MTPPAPQHCAHERKILYDADITPEALADIQIGDWVQGIGDITCHFEQDFIRRISKWVATLNTTNSAHCAHERVCDKMWYHLYNQTYCIEKDCKDDTRKAAAIAEHEGKQTPMRCCFGNFDDCPCDDECTLNLYCEKYCESLRMQCNIQWAVDDEHDERVRDKVLAALIKWATPIKDNWANNDCHRDPFDEVIKKCESLRRGEHQ